MLTRTRPHTMDFVLDFFFFCLFVSFFFVLLFILVTFFTSLVRNMQPTIYWEMVFFFVVRERVKRSLVVALPLRRTKWIAQIIFHIQTFIFIFLAPVFSSPFRYSSSRFVSSTVSFLDNFSSLFSTSHFLHFLVFDELSIEQQTNENNVLHVHVPKTLISFLVEKIKALFQ